jgi:hypothetical protein
MSAPEVKCRPSVDELRMMLFAGTLTYFEKTLSLVVVYDDVSSVRILMVLLNFYYYPGYVGLVWSTLSLFVRICFIASLIMLLL